MLERSVELLASAKCSSSVDIFGNTTLYGSMISPHDIFVVATSGVVECSHYEIIDADPMPLFLASTRVTQVDHEMIDFDATIPCEGSELEQAMALCDALHTKIEYRSGVTTAESRACESFALGAGVCQDYSHILIALCRHRGIRARYVAGLVVGTGETHAWVEIYCDGAWRGVDPTYNVLIEYGYIKLAHGRDAADCSVARGVHRGGAGHTTEVHVVVEELFDY